MKYLWGIGALILLLIWLFFPSIFNWWAVHVWNLSGSNLDRLGPLGDIYGSLNTLISSIALCAVAFSTWLQVNSLIEMRNANSKQFDLAKLMHNEQLRESQISIFNNQFFALLNFKNDYYTKMSFIKREKNREESFLAKKFFEETSKRVKFSLKLYKDNISSMDSDYLKMSFNSSTFEYFENSESFTLYSYYSIYAQLLMLINDSVLNDTEKKIYKTIIANSMNYHEQVTLFFVIPMFDEFKQVFKNSNIFTHFWGDDFKGFALKHYDESYFNLPQWIDFFETSNKVSPA